MPDELLERLRRFQTDAFPQQRSLFRHLVDEGLHPLRLFIGCSDSRVVPYLLRGAVRGVVFLALFATSLALVIAGRAVFALLCAAVTFAAMFLGAWLYDTSFRSEVTHAV